jgi:hypothetical protein
MAEVMLHDQYQSVSYAGTPRIWAPGAGDDESRGAAEGADNILAKIGPGEEAQTDFGAARARLRGRLGLCVRFGSGPRDAGRAPKARR